jgi:hypothetical protein
MKFMNQARKFGTQAKVVAGSALLAVGSVAYADNVDTAITGLGTTASSYIADAVGVALIVAGGFWGIGMMKKAFSAAK